MKYSKLLLAAMAALGVASAHAAVDTVQYSTGYFVDVDANKTQSPYYRWNGDDWGWQHGAIGSGFATASLNISAYDVDEPGEVDNIFALDSGEWKLLGSLAGNNNTWAFTAFNLGSNFFDDIATGLHVKIAIDTNDQGWAVTLAKSTLTTDGSGLPTPIPGVPEPETYAMLLAGLGVMGAVARRRKARAAA